MTTEQFESHTDFLARMKRQFEFGPYPRISIETFPQDDPNSLFIHNLLTPYYLWRQQLPTTEGKVILDAGCGTGYKAAMLAEANPGAKVIGVDLSPKSLELAQQRIHYLGYQDRVEFHLLNLEDIAQLGLQFDYINCDEVLYYFNDIAEELTTLKTVLKPDGIMRANLHSLFQRQAFFRAQELFNLMGLMEESAEEMAIPIVQETMKALRPNVSLKQQTWGPAYEEDDNHERLLMNHLMQEDKGYRIADMFRALEKANLDFLCMVNWHYWNVAELFNEPDNLPSYLALGLMDSPVETQLTIYELLNPVYRLLDFWCTHPTTTSNYVPVANWTLKDWQTSRVFLHPQLKTELFRKSATHVIDQNGTLQLHALLKAPAPRTFSVSASFTTLLLHLWEAPRTFDELIDFWLLIYPVDAVTLKPSDRNAVSQKIIEFLKQLEIYLYIMVMQL